MKLGDSTRNQVPARGANFDSLDGTSDNLVMLLTEPLIDALRSGPFKGKVPADRPEKRSSQPGVPSAARHAIVDFAGFPQQELIS